MIGQPPSSFGGRHLISMQFEEASTISRGPRGGLGLSITHQDHILDLNAEKNIASAKNLHLIGLPSTTRLVVASVVPNSFFILILISPVSLRCSLLRDKRQWLSVVSILQFASVVSSSPSLYHCILVASRPIYGILNSALCLLLTTLGLANSSRSFVANLGGSRKQIHLRGPRNIQVFNTK